MSKIDRRRSSSYRAVFGNSQRNYSGILGNEFCCADPKFWIPCLIIAVTECPLRPTNILHAMDSGGWRLLKYPWSCSGLFYLNVPTKIILRILMGIMTMPITLGDSLHELVIIHKSKRLMLIHTIIAKYYNV